MSTPTPMETPTETTETDTVSATQTTQQYVPEDIVADHDAETPNKDISRVVVIAIDQSNYSHLAFDWAVKNILRESDLVIAL